MKVLFKYTYIFFVAMASCITANAQDLVILHTNDVHNQITPQITGKNKGLSGYERREAYIKEVVKEHGKKNVLLLDGGDFSMGSSYMAVYQGYVAIELFNVLGYDAVCLGNHEFDKNQEELANRISNADFAMLCANYDFTKSPLNGLVKPYTIVKKAGKRIGIIGIMLDISFLAMSREHKNLSYTNPIDVLNTLAKELKNEHKCDLVIALSHCGLYTEIKGKFIDDEYIATHVENVDIIVGGHSHTNMENMLTVKDKQGKDVIIVHDGEKGEYIGRLDLYW